MLLQNETVICVKNNNETWSAFNENYYVKELPKRIDTKKLESGQLGHQFDTNVEPTKRIPEFYASISEWATHIYCLGKFINEHNTEWLLVVESDINLGSVPEPSPGITIFNDDATAYIIDRNTAKTILDNSLIYYTPFKNLLLDLKNIDLIDLRKGPHFEKIKSAVFYDFLPFILFFIFFLILLLFYPFYSLITENLISLAKMTGPKESAMSR